MAFMLGPPKRRALDQPVTISLESLVPADHFYRHLDAQLDLRFVREWVQDCYAARGRPAIDPVVFFKLQLIMFFEVRPVLPKLGEALDAGTRGRQTGDHIPVTWYPTSGAIPGPCGNQGQHAPHGSDWPSIREAGAKPAKTRIRRADAGS